MNTKPTIYIKMAAYNVEEYIDIAITSILDQSYKNWKLILIENGSTDSTREIVREYAAKDDRILLEELEWNTIKYPGKSKSKLDPLLGGLEEVDNDHYLTFLDSDDYYEQDALETMVKTALKNNSDMVITGCTVFANGTDKGYTRLPLDMSFNSKNQFSNAFIHMYGSIRTIWGNLFKIKVVKETMNIVEKSQLPMLNGFDTMFNLISLDISINVSSTSKATVFYRLRDDSYYHLSIYPDRYKSYNDIYDKTYELLTKWNGLNIENLMFINSVRLNSMKDTVENSSKCLNIDEAFKSIQNILTDKSFCESLEIIEQKNTFLVNCLNLIKQNTKINILQKEHLAAYKYFPFYLSMTSNSIKFNSIIDVLYYFCGVYHSDNVYNFGIEFMPNVLQFLCAKSELYISSKTVAMLTNKYVLRELLNGNSGYNLNNNIYLEGLYDESIVELGEAFYLSETDVKYIEVEKEVMLRMVDENKIEEALEHVFNVLSINPLSLEALMCFSLTSVLTGDIEWALLSSQVLKTMYDNNEDAVRSIDLTTEYIENFYAQQGV